MEHIQWTSRSELVILAESSIHYHEEGYGFFSSFYVGRRLTFAEERHLYVEAVRSEGPPYNWEGLGFVGGGTSSHGNYEVVDGALVWETPKWLTATQSYTVAASIPLDHEIVVYTVNYWWNGGVSFSAQRFILWADRYGGLHMLESAETPEPIWSEDTLAEFGLETLPPSSAPLASPEW